MSKNTFFDHVSTTPCDPRVVEAMLPYFTELFGNPSSHIHKHGIAAAQGMDQARLELLELVQGDDARVIFTSGATEANNLALIGMAAAADKSRRHILLSEVEHYSIYNLMAPLQAMEFEVEFIQVDRDGIISPAQLAKKLRDDTLLVSVMHANGEIGCIQPIKELAELAYSKGAMFHTDATISGGHIPIDFAGWKLDALTLSAHNFYGPKGTGALLLGEGVKIRPINYGGWQEDGLRSGTENLPGIVGMGAAAKLAGAEMSEWAEKLTTLGKQLWEKLEEEVPFIRITGPREGRLPGHISFWVEHVEGESLILFLNAKGISAASGSACSSNLKAEDEDDLVHSHVLESVGVPTDICAGSVTMSLGKDTNEADIEKAVEEMKIIVDRLLMMSPSYADYLQQKEKDGE